ncbi:hypothetical protein BSL78_19384, partial [Apostichopus japonicus]
MAGTNTINLSEYFLGGLGACGACLFTNPLEVVKTRMQLQGELRSRGSYSRHYRNVFHAFFTIGKVDGLRALQKGLIPGLWYQLFMNGVRLGTYQTLVNFGMTKNSEGEVSLPKSVAAGAFSGCVGAVFGTHFICMRHIKRVTPRQCSFHVKPWVVNEWNGFPEKVLLASSVNGFKNAPVDKYFKHCNRIKTHLQALADQRIAVGHQHQHSGMIQAFRGIISREGVRGLWRGATGAMARVSVGSAAQLSTFSKCKDIVEQLQIFSPGSILIPLVASMVGGVAVVCCMTPFDVISTRLYNQGVDAKGRGLYYSGVADCFWKILNKEGPFGFYK